MMLRASVLCPSFDKVICAANLFAVCTSNAAARACSPSLFLISTFLTTRLIGSLVAVAVLHVNEKAAVCESLLQRFDQNDGAMAPAGTAQSQGQAALALALVKRQSELEQCIKPIEKLAGFGVAEHVIAHGGIKAILGPELIDKIGIRQEADIKDDVGIVRNSEFIAEGNKKQRHPAPCGRLAKLLLHFALEVVHIEIASVDDFVGQGANRLECLALARNSLLDRVFSGLWVRPAGFTEPPQQDVVGSIEKHDLHMMAGLPQDAVPTGHTPFVPRTPFAQPIATNMEAVRSNVLVVYAGGGHGSGFMIDDEGHLLTNEHVVRTAERVRVRFESGEELTAAVLATDARRDVALLKVERGVTGGLPIRFDPPSVGDEVYAVGAPLDPSYSATVSKGIVSSLRTLDGEQWIQSDVNVQPGNSGGPLLDDRGNIIGLTSRGAPTDAGTPSGVNFFVPITDALGRLGLGPKGAAS